MEYDCMNCGNVHTPEEGCPDETAVSNSALSGGVKLPFSVSHIIKLTREYAEANKCTCTTDATCWKCTFEYNLRCLDAEEKKAT